MIVNSTAVIKIYWANKFNCEVADGSFKSEEKEC